MEKIHQALALLKQLPETQLTAGKVLSGAMVTISSAVAAPATHNHSHTHLLIQPDSMASEARVDMALGSCGHHQLLHLQRAFMHSFDGLLMHSGLQGIWPRVYTASRSNDHHSSAVATLNAKMYIQSLAD